MGKKDSSTEMEKIGKLIYKDLGHPALSQVGNAVGSLIRLVALPITFLGLTAEELEKKYAKFIQKTLEAIFLILPSNFHSAILTSNHI